MVKTQHDREILITNSFESDPSSNNANVSQCLINLFDSYFDGRDKSQDDFIERFENFIKPLNTAVDFCKTNFPDAICGKAIYEDAREMLLIHGQWKANIEGYSEMFATVTNTLQQSVDSLAEAVDYFENHTVVKCWCR